VSRRRADHGTASIEVVALVPLVILVAMFALQLGVAGWTASQTEEAARQSARAQSLGQDPRSAAERALPGTLSVDRISAGGDTVTLWVDVPRVSLLPVFTVSRSVSLTVDP
jgi:Flp pilus assembly protein TadG